MIAVIGKGKTLPLMNADNTDQEKSGDRRDRKGKVSPLINTDNTDLNGNRRAIARNAKIAQRSPKLKVKTLKHGGREEADE